MGYRTMLDRSIPPKGVIDVHMRNAKVPFLIRMHALLDWDTIGNLMDTHCPKEAHAIGQSGYDNLLLFKTCLLQKWYGFDDDEIRDEVRNCSSLAYFCKLSVDRLPPDQDALSRFRAAITEAGIYEKLFKIVDDQLEKKKADVKNALLISELVEKRANENVRRQGG